LEQISWRDGPWDTVSVSRDSYVAVYLEPLGRSV
jgi:hypothetical protein